MIENAVRSQGPWCPPAQSSATGGSTTLREVLPETWAPLVPSVRNILRACFLLVTVLQ